MKDLTVFDKWRMNDPFRDDPAIADVSGTFAFRLPGNPTPFVVVASNGDGWDHVSVSTRDRCPTWDEMDAIKRLFFKPGETAMQLHVAVDKHVNVHPFTLHLWRPHGVKRAIPLPPEEFV